LLVDEGLYHQLRAVFLHEFNRLDNGSLEGVKMALRDPHHVAEQDHFVGF
jgi:hypothetical protein